MDVSKEQVAAATQGLFYQDKYKELSPALGGWYWTTEAIWAVFSSWPIASIQSLEQLVTTALAVPGRLASLADEFVADLFDVLAILQEDLPDIAAGAAAGASIAAQAMMVVTTGVAGTGGGTYETAVITAAAIAVGVLTFGAPAGLIAGSVIAAGAVIGGGVAAGRKGTARRISRSISRSRTARRLARR